MATTDKNKQAAQPGTRSNSQKSGKGTASTGNANGRAQGGAQKSDDTKSPRKQNANGGSAGRR